MITKPDPGQEQYMRDEPAVRLCNLASDLQRLSKWAWHAEHDLAAITLMDQIAARVEWNGECATEQLVDIQREIRRWREIWPLEPAREILSFRAQRMSMVARSLADELGASEGGLIDGAPPLVLPALTASEQAA